MIIGEQTSYKMESINWSKVIFNEENQKLIIIDQNLKTIPMAIINLYCNKVTYLDLSFNTITSLDSLNLFRQLDTLILDNNKIDDKSLQLLQSTRCKHQLLKILSLNNNLLKDLSKVLKSIADIFPNLEHLSLLGNSACPDGLSPETNSTLSYGFYRQQVAESFPKLKFLDYKEVHKDFYGSLPIKRPETLKYSPKILLARITSNSDHIYEPLPNNLRRAGDHCGTYGISNIKYIGQHSEGNRYIRNTDL